LLELEPIQCVNSTETVCIAIVYSQVAVWLETPKIHRAWDIKSLGRVKARGLGSLS